MAKQFILFAFVTMFGVLVPELLRADGIIFKMTGPDGRTKTSNPAHPPKRGEEPIIDQLLTYRETAEECRNASKIIGLETNVHNPYETPNYKVSISEDFGFCRLDYYAIVRRPWRCSTDDIGFCLRSIVENEFSLPLPHGSATDSRALQDWPNDAPLKIYFDLTNLDSAAKFASSDKDCRVVFGGVAHPSLATDSVFIFLGNVTLSKHCFVG
ncbi:hypothetical protein [Inquilinus limosus]|uniref:hypothetical protein n=1 Tax=Inquilinus limosus TaxID=171674 RepID=UPI0011982718|nr:hypothetical protein [Inquilinus limosus]